jgi:DNA-binding CsgD family transcriptional regulator
VTDHSTGAPGAGKAHPGTHVCALYSGPDERDRLLVPFMQEGLRHGDECVCLIDDVEPASMRRRAGGAVAPGDGRRPGRLGVYPVSDVCPRVGELSVEQAVTLLGTASASSSDEGPLVVRAAAEMSWPHRPGAQDLLGYESAVTQVLADLPAVFLCMYDLKRFEVGLLIDVLRIHSTVLLDGTVLHNPGRLAPTDRPRARPDGVGRYPLARRPGGRPDGGDEWLCLTAAEVRVAELVASGMTNRGIAEELFVSHHTVDAHLKHIYVKLGIHSRVELTRLALRHGARAT